MHHLLVADSFRVRTSPPAVRGFSLHLNRFRNAVHSAGWRDEQTLEAFITDAVRRIAEYGEGNPRLELWDSAPELRLSLRPLPQLQDTIELQSVQGVTTVHPEQKGPNIDTFTALNRDLGAEALLVDESGHIIEGATTAIVWWAAGTGYVSAAPARVQSVTEALVRRIAVDRGDSLVSKSITPRDLTGHAGRADLALHADEVWAVNALHGIRPVTAIDGSPAPEPSARLAHYRRALDCLWEPFDAEATAAVRG